MGACYTLPQRKVFGNCSAKSRARAPFKREFRALTDVHHPKASALGVVEPLTNLRASHPELVIDKGLDTAFAEAARKAT